jgi:phage terminase large subunit
MDLLDRLKYRYLCDNNLDYRRHFIELCRRDTVLWVNTFCFTYDPRLKDPFIPFLLFPKQEEIIRFFEGLYQEKQRGLFDKSRDVGATWLMCAFFAKHWLYTPGFKGALGSRKAELVDKKGDPDCIFEKIRMIINNLPSWMIPDGWEKLSRSFLIKNPLNDATLTGEGGDNLGRGGRSSVYLVDESAFIERSKKVIAALSQNTDCLVQVSTPNGTDNEFYRAITSGVYPRISIHWKDDPRKNHWILDDVKGNGWDAPKGAIYPWYEKQCLELDPVVIAQELDLDYTASVEGIYIRSIWVKAAINAHLRIPEIEFGDNYIGLDVATEGSNKTVLTVRRGGLVLPPMIWSGVDTTQTSFKTDSYAREIGAVSVCFDADGVGAGVAGTLSSIENKPYWVEPFHGASTKGMELTFWSGENKTSKEKFKNKRAEAWGLVRERFKKTYEVMEGIKEHPPEELISIPNHPDLITQLSQPTIKYDPSGKIVLAPKNLLASSPDIADSLVYAFVNTNQVSWWG